jgi:hypothetical protein
VWSALSRAQAQAREALMRYTQKGARGGLIRSMVAFVLR